MHVVLLEHPRAPSAFHFNDIANTPLWSCLMTGYAASALLEAGFDATIIDASRRSFKDAARLVLDTPCDLLAVHAVYFWERTGELFEMLSKIRRKGYGGVICLFGFFPTLVWSDILDHAPAVDCVVVGEPERTLVELAESVKKGSIARCSGLAARVGSRAALFEPRAAIDPVDRIPFPLRPALEAEQTVSVLASRGCYNGCSFCLIPTLDGGKALWRGRSAENIAAEVLQLKERGKGDIYFVDPNFIGPGKAGKDRAMDLSRALAELDVTFGMETRANDITLPLVLALREGGLSSLLLGLESGSPRVLERLCKHTSVAQNERAIAVLRDAGVEPEIGFIMFEPASTLEDVIENMHFLERNRLLDRLGRTANLLYHAQIAFKGTPGYRMAREQGMLAPEGLFGFEGRLLYEDHRVGWLAGIMRSMCQLLLKEMGREASPIHWSAEAPGEQAFQAINDRLVETFKRMLATAAKLDGEPEPGWTEQLMAEALEELQLAPAEEEMRGVGGAFEKGGKLQCS